MIIVESGVSKNMASPFIVLKTAVFTVLVPGTVVEFIPRLLAQYDQEPPLLNSRIVQIIGRISLLSGILLYVHIAWRFSAEGEGTPSPSDELHHRVTKQRNLLQAAFIPICEIRCMSAYS